MFGRAILIFLIGIFAVILLIAGIYYATRPARAAEAVDSAVVFLVDVSGSMDESEVVAARQAHVVALESQEVLEAVHDGTLGKIAVAYVEFGDIAKIGVDWTIIDGPASAAVFADKISALPMGGYLGGSFTAVGAALLVADELLGRAPPSSHLVVDIVGDGTNSIPPHPSMGREAILSRGGVINCLPVLMLEPDPNLVPWYTTQVAGGPGHFVMPIDGISKVPMALRSKIVQELY